MGTGVGAVGHVVGADLGQSGRDADPAGAQRIDRRLSGIGGTVDDAVADLDAIGVDGQVQVRQGIEHQAEVVADRLFRLQVLGAEQPGRRRVDRQQAAGDGRRDTQAGVVLLGQRRCAEAAAETGPRRHLGAEAVAAGELAVGGAAEVAVVLIARRRLQLPTLAEGGGQVEIGAEHVAAPLSGAGRRLSGERLGTAVVVGPGIAGLDLVEFAALLQAPGEIQRRRQPGEVEVAAQVEIVGPLGGLVARQVEGARRIAGLAVEGEVDRMVHADLRAVGAVGRAEVPVPGAEQLAATGAEGQRIVVLVAGDARGEAVRIEPRRQGRQLVDLRRGHRAMGIGGEAVQLDVVVQRHAGVVGQRLAVQRRVADGRVAVAPGALVDAGADGPRLLAELRAEVEETALAETQAAIHPAVLGQAVAIAVATVVVGEPAAVVGRLEDDVDHPGDGVRAVLRRGAVAQHLDALDGGERDGVQVDPGGAALQPAADIDIGGLVAALAVHQHQHVVGTQAAQRLRVGQRRSVVGLGLARQRGQQAHQGVAQVAAATVAQLLGADHIDRCQALAGLDIGLAGAGDHHRGQGPGGLRRRQRGIRRRGALQAEHPGGAAAVFQAAALQGPLQRLLDAVGALDRRCRQALHQVLVEGDRGATLADDAQQYLGQFAGRDVEALDLGAAGGADLLCRRLAGLAEAGQADRAEHGDESKTWRTRVGHGRFILERLRMPPSAIARTDFQPRGRPIAHKVMPRPPAPGSARR